MGERNHFQESLMAMTYILQWARAYSTAEAKFRVIEDRMWTFQRSSVGEFLASFFPAFSLTAYQVPSSTGSRGFCSDAGKLSLPELA